MKYIITYKICGKEHKVKVTALSQNEAGNRIINSLEIIKCEPEEDETLRNFKSILGIFD